ncbi:transglycosylase domain-containing protein [Microbacterium sp. X-17]|uniref:transglycosylase domain-containing protein n=1 Tax=Microbacterium sp. X-17 TaxID=3144404 RepID=UPI0031F5D3A6
MPASKRTSGGVLGGIAGLVGLSVAAGVLITATVTPAIAVSGAAASSAITLFDNLPSVLAIDDLMLPTTLYANDPNTHQPVVMTSFYDQNRSPVTFDQVAPVMYDAILSSEDKNFYQHGGIDLVGTTRALLSGGSSGGGSSISQQYVKNILIQKCERDAPTQDAKDQCFNDATASNGTQGYERKLQEMRYAIALEQKYSKDEILLGYLNIANFGGTTYGIDAAAKYYFGVPASQLNLAQAATLAGMVQTPNTYRIDRPDGTTTDAAGKPVNSQADGYSITKARQTYVLDRMLANGKITQQQHDDAVAAPIQPHITPPQAGCDVLGAAAYFCQYVVSVIQNDPAFGATADDRAKALRQGGLKIYTTLDWNVQNAAQQAIADNVPTSLAGMNLGSTSTSVEVNTGRILSIAQNTKFTQDPSLANDPNYSSIVYAGDSTFGGSAGFSAGSTFKLFTLVDWLEKGHSLNEYLNGNDRVIPKMTNSCTGNWINTENWVPGNFEGEAGFYGTPMQFTAKSTNSGYLAMAEQLDLCDIAKVATKMGVTTGDGRPITMSVANNVIGSDNISPLTMAAAYATIANNGTYCQPTPIDKVTNSQGVEQPKPNRTCTQVIAPNIAATAATALAGVMASGGTGRQGNPLDGTSLIGKTGTHQDFQTWIIEANTRVVTANWVGNADGEANLFQMYTNNGQVANLRYAIGKSVQRAVDQFYPGGNFPAADPTLLRTVLKDVPNVVGMPVDQATTTLQNAGFQVTVGSPVDSDQPANIVVTQSSTRAAAGSVITISPSNGQGGTIPSGIVGMSPADAKASLASAGFANVTAGAGCEVPTAKVSASSPAPGTAANKAVAVTLTCAVAGNGNGNGNGGH